MEPHALVQARQRFARAEAALAAFEASTNFEEAETAWTDFLMATSTIYSKLEQGAKSNGKSQAWYGRQKKRRKNEPVLRYIHFARNSDEHGIERITERKANNNDLFGTPFKFNERKEVKFFRGRDPETGELIPNGTGWACGPTIHLMRATDSRYGDYCDPPEIPDSIPKDPLALARVALGLIETMLDDAEALI